MSVDFIKSKTRCDYASFTPHEVFKMIYNASDEAIKQMASQITTTQYAYLKRIKKLDTHKLMILTNARTKVVQKVATLAPTSSKKSEEKFIARSAADEEESYRIQMRLFHMMCDPSESKSDAG